MYRQPDRITVRGGPGDPVPAAGGDQQVIAADEAVGFRITFKQNPGRTCQEQHPLVLLLFKPLPFRGSLPTGNDAFDADSIRAGYGFKNFTCCRGGESGKYVVNNWLHGCARFF